MKGFFRSIFGLAERVSIDFNLDDQRQSLREFLKALRPIVDLGRGKRWELDLTQCEYLGSYGAAVILATALQAGSLDQNFTIRWPNHPKINQFRELSGLDHWLEQNSPPPEANHHTMIPLRQIRQTTFDAPSAVLSLVRRHISLDNEQETYLQTSVYETLQNVEDHAGSSIGAVFCARFVEVRRNVRVAIIDRGEGVFSTLRRTHPDTNSTAMALSRVIQGGYSAKSRETNMGLGVSNLWDVVARAMRGEICIVSEDCVAYNGKHGAPRYEGLGYRFPGTGVFFNVPVADRREVGR